MRHPLKALCVKLVMFLSSCMPLFILLSFSYWAFPPKGYGSIAYFAFKSFINISILVSLGSSVCLLRCKACRTLVGYTGAQRTNTETLLYVSLHLIPLFLLQCKNAGIGPFFVFMLFLGGIYIRGNMFHINPCLAWLGYQGYQTSEGVMIITNIPFKKIKQFSTCGLKGTFLFNGIFFARGTDNILD